MLSDRGTGRRGMCIAAPERLEPARSWPSAARAVRQWLYAETVHGKRRFRRKKPPSTGPVRPSEWETRPISAKASHDRLPHGGPSAHPQAWATLMPVESRNATLRSLAETDLGVDEGVVRRAGFAVDCKKEEFPEFIVQNSSVIRELHSPDMRCFSIQFVENMGSKQSNIAQSKVTKGS